MDWQATLKVLAPTVATALAGPLGGAAVTAIGSILGIDKPTQDAISKVITSGQMTADQVAQIRQLEMQYQNDEKERDFRYEELVFKDRDSARNRQIQTRDTTPQKLAYMIIGGFMVVAIAQLAALMGWPDEAAKIPAQGWVIIGNISGYLAAEAKAAASFFFGTTASSQEKTQLLAQAAPIDLS